MFEIVEVLVQSERAIAQLLRLQHSCYHCCCRFGSVSSRRLGPAFKVGLNFVRHFGSFKTARLFIKETQRHSTWTPFRGGGVLHQYVSNKRALSARCGGEPAAVVVARVETGFPVLPKSSLVLKFAVAASACLFE